MYDILYNLYDILYNISCVLNPIIAVSTQNTVSQGYKFLQLIGDLKLPGNSRLTVIQLSKALLICNQAMANDILLGRIGEVFTFMNSVVDLKYSEKLQYILWFPLPKDAPH